MGKINKKSEEEKALTDRFKDAFNAYVGCGKKYSRNTISEILGVSTRTVELWGTYNNDSRPNIHNLWKLYFFLPAGYRSMIQDLYDNGEKRNINHMENIAQFTQFLARYAEIIKDGKIDNN